MSDLDDYRAEIDKIDKELVQLFEKRMDMVLKVAKYKKANNVQVFHKNREDQVVEKGLSHLKNKDYSDEVVKFIHSNMEIGKGLQRRLIEDGKKINDIHINREEIDLTKKVGYPGVKGAFSEEAAITFFGEDIDRTAYENFEDVFEAIESGEIYYGIVPIENSSTGAISQNYDFIRKYGYYIVGEVSLKVEQHLIGIKGATIDDIEEVYSHPQGIEQSSDFLKNYEAWKLIPFSNTATSAKLVKDLSDKKKAAIASKRAAQIYNLDIIKERVNNELDNNTRFIVICKECKVVNDADKVSVMFALEHEAGTLYRLLKYFAENNINMCKIESRPMKDTPWEYYLYVDFEGDIDNSDVKNALRLIEKNAVYFKLLGAYKSRI